MAIRAFTFDFWNTLVDGSADSGRADARLDCFLGLAERHGVPLARGEAAAAIQRGEARIADRLRLSSRAMGPPARWGVLADELGIPANTIPIDEVLMAYRQFVLKWPSPLLPGAAEAVRRARAAGFRVGVICNTGFGGGSVLRELLAHHGLASLFDITVWSDEVGWCKPDRRIFCQALSQLGGLNPGEVLHIGDDEELDVHGARSAGFWTARYRNGPPMAKRSAADMIIPGWQSFSPLLAASQCSRHDPQASVPE